MYTNENERGFGVRFSASHKAHKELSRLFTTYIEDPQRAAKDFLIFLGTVLIIYHIIYYIFICTIIILQYNDRENLVSCMRKVRIINNNEPECIRQYQYYYYKIVV